MTLRKSTTTSAPSIHNDQEHVLPADQPAPTPPPLLTGRGHSDSALPNCRLLASKTSVAEDASLPVTSSALSDGGRPATVKSALSTSAPPKAKIGLRLPSFQSLGIATPTGHPTALLTPPEESGIPDALTNSGFNLHQPRSQSFPQVEMPASPKLAEASVDPTPAEPIEDATPRQENVPLPEALDPRSTNLPALPIPYVDVSSVAWATEAIRDTVCTASELASRGNVIVLCHSQPCPLPSELSPTTAFPDLMSAIQTRTQAFIEVTHAMPLKFNMNQVPNSPAITPNLMNEQANDYFSIQNIFSKAVVATSYQDAVGGSVPSSPHPIVCPNSVHLSLLERYIPPGSMDEYRDLFSNEVPSALVNRLTELHQDDSRLLFIYPTRNGALTFKSEYLAPLLDPVLRSMSGFYSLRSDLGTNIAKMVAIDQMESYEGMLRRINALLTKLSRASKHSPRPPRRFKIMRSTAQRVPVDRASWQEWYLYQEKERIQGLVKRYYQRGDRLPTQSDHTVTQGLLCREIYEGLKQREYPLNSSPKADIELGIFVIQRLA
ncbi:MAG: hypothetical protein OHK93_006771 [Ramalina farinacea]|uniref:Uncharacterized protein n=1 Tax=Ramalina farinacea TaxID=258253 RepID=A0AA43TQE6_9LECA|nr:hypothetical protein [Ramalina farinacea]